MWSLIKRLFSRKVESPPPPSPRLANASINRVYPVSTDVIYGNQRLSLSLSWVKPEKKVYIYTVSDDSFETGNTIIKSLKIPGKEKGKRYRYITSIPDVVNVPNPRTDCGKIYTVATSGVRVAVDLIWPDCLGDDLDKGPKPESCLSIGRNLAKLGVFYSLSKPPKKQDLEAAERRLANNYKEIIAQAKAYYWGTGKSPEGDFGKRVAAAAEYLGITNIPWNRRKTDKESR